jgi:hypothetical protein
VFLHLFGPLVFQSFTKTEPHAKVRWTALILKAERDEREDGLSFHVQAAFITEIERFSRNTVSFSNATPSERFFPAFDPFRAALTVG